MICFIHKTLTPRMFTYWGRLKTILYSDLCESKQIMSVKDIVEIFDYQTPQRFGVQFSIYISYYNINSELIMEKYNVIHLIRVIISTSLSLSAKPNKCDIKLCRLCFVLIRKFHLLSSRCSLIWFWMPYGA